MAPQLNALLEQGASNFGVSGETSTQIKTRLLASSDIFLAMPTTIWAGRNNVDAPTTVKADIAAMVAKLITTNYRVIGVTPTSSAAEQSGGANYARLVTLNADLATTYGAKFFDAKALLQAHGDGSAQDNADIAADLIPSSLRSDLLHLNTAGYALVAAGLKTDMSLI